ncbi:MAG: biopolymer transporter ExbD [Elusimicrobia bacterium]|nr:biopolymer transporter ExbD [Elusimicrobiota bacterium]MBI3012865.1 biopolymer transporter ExbD [Elusimicrobiota bacterium]
MQSSSQDDLVTGINVTPLVDVGLVLVIIFMVTAPLFELPSLKVNLPQTHTKEGEERENVTVTITSDGTMAVNEQIVSASDLEQVLKNKIQSSGEKHVIIKADKESLHENLLLVMRLAKGSGSKTIDIATEPKESGYRR